MGTDKALATMITMRIHTAQFCFVKHQHMKIQSERANVNGSWKTNDLSCQLVLIHFFGCCSDSDCLWGWVLGSSQVKLAREFMMRIEELRGLRNWARVEWVSISWVRLVSATRGGLHVVLGYELMVFFFSFFFIFYTFLFWATPRDTQGSPGRLRGPYVVLGIETC